VASPLSLSKYYIVLCQNGRYELRRETVRRGSVIPLMPQGTKGPVSTHIKAQRIGLQVYHNISQSHHSRFQFTYQTHISKKDTMVKFTSAIVIAFAALATAAPTNDYPKYGKFGEFEAVNNEKRTNDYPKYGKFGEFEAVNNEKRTNDYPKYGKFGEFEAVNNEKRTNDYPKYGKFGEFEAVNNEKRTDAE
ncbi:hypothetical protein HDV62DRAFT_139094, partial [Trichoderma sp. SZMC 28011]